MSTIAAHGRKTADYRQEGRLIGRIPAGALALALGMAPVLATEVAAQSRSGIYINNDVLNSLGPGPEAAPLAPMAPAAPPTPLSPRSHPAYQAPAYQAPAMPPAADGNGSLGFQPYGSGNFVMTRPGTLLFPPLQDPTSTLTPGFAGGQPDNHAARARALDNAFAEGPEPSSQLLIPLDGPAGSPAQGNDSITVFMDNLPAADPDADPSSAPVLVLQAPPQPAPRKPAVPADALAGLQQPQPVEDPAVLAPEFETPPPEMTPPPAIVELPPEAPVERTALDATAPAGAEAAVAEQAVVEPTADAASTMAESTVPAVPEPAAPEPAMAEPAMAAPASSAEVPAPADLAETPVPAAPAPAAPAPAAPAPAAPAPAAPNVAEAPVSLLPEAPSPLQTVSLTIGAMEDRSLLFEVDSAELSPEAQSELRSLALALHGSDGADIQVLGFASGQDASADQARKLALSRALKVRSFLIDEGIASARIRVRSLGDRVEGGPANRVDIKPIGS